MKPVTMADWKVTPLQKKLVNEVLDSGRLTYGPMTRQLEERFGALHNRDFALFTNSGTSALKIALHALKDRHGWRDGDEVIIPAVTFVATMNVVLMNNLKPVLVDVNLADVNINTDEIEVAITPRTRAIIPVHLLGQVANMGPIMEIAHRYDLKVVEDSCETMFVEADGYPVGSRGDVACFSTYIAHLMVTGVGGFITTNDSDLAVIMRSMMFHGRDESYLNIDDNLKTGQAFSEMITKRFYFPRNGYSDRATELEAALGLGDLENWQEMIKIRQQNAKKLRKLLGKAPVTFPVTDFDNHAFMFFPMLVPDRDKLIMHLEAGGIHTRTMMPLTIQPITQPYITGQYPNADVVNERGILLGCHQYLKQEDLEYMANEILEFYNA